MKVALISFNLIAMGVRSISSYLRSNGIETKIIFIPFTAGYIKLGQVSDVKNIYNDTLLSNLVELCKDCDVIGISLMNYEYNRACQITNYLKERFKDKIIVWGGIYPTVNPDECLNTIDYIFRGESEFSFFKFLEDCRHNKDYHDTPGLGYRKNGTITMNSPHPLIDNLDELPVIDYSLNEHYIYNQQRECFELLTMEGLKDFGYRLNVFGKDYLCYNIMATRGCNFACTYCVNNALVRFYKTRKIFRYRSPLNVINELAAAKSKFKMFNAIYFVDDDVTGVPMEYLEEFCDLYKQRNINLSILARFTPHSMSEEKLKMLIDIGLIETGMGIESGCKKIRLLYKRNFNDSLMIEKSKIFNKYRDKVRILYSVITDNPYETVEDKIENMRFLIKLAKPFELVLFSLKIFEGTELYDKATHELTKADEKQKLKFNRSLNQDYFILTKDYFNYIYFLAQLRIPPFILYFLVNPFIVKFLNSKFILAIIPISPMDFNRYIHNFRLVKGIIKQHKFGTVREILKILRSKKEARRKTSGL